MRNALRKAVPRVSWRVAPSRATNYRCSSALDLLTSQRWVSCVENIVWVARINPYRQLPPVTLQFFRWRCQCAGVIYLYLSTKRLSQGNDRRPLRRLFALWREFFPGRVSHDIRDASHNPVYFADGRCGLAADGTFRHRPQSINSRSCFERRISCRPNQSGSSIAETPFGPP